MIEFVVGRKYRRKSDHSELLTCLDVSLSGIRMEYESDNDISEYFSDAYWSNTVEEASPKRESHSLVTYDIWRFENPYFSPCGTDVAEEALLDRFGHDNCTSRYIALGSDGTYRTFETKIVVEETSVER